MRLHDRRSILTPLTRINDKCNLQAATSLRSVQVVVGNVSDNNVNNMPHIARAAYRPLACPQKVTFPTVGSGHSSIMHLGYLTDCSRVDRFRHCRKKIWGRGDSHYKQKNILKFFTPQSGMLPLDHSYACRFAIKRLEVDLLSSVGVVALHCPSRHSVMWLDGVHVFTQRWMQRHERSGRNLLPNY